MKVNLFALCITMSSASFLFATNGRGQDLEKIRVVLSLNNASLYEALMQIEKQSDFRFTYKEEDIRAYSDLKVKKASRSVKATLDLLLRNTRIAYEQVGNYIVLTEKPKDLQQAADDPFPVFTVSGKVTDDTGGALPGVNVVVKGTTMGTVTDVDGNYDINVPDENGILIFSFIGYSMEEVPINGRSEINVTMTEDVRNLDEVVVVGYGTQKKSHLTGAIGKIEMNAELSSQPIVDFGQAMYGRVPGVQVIKSSGRPGEASTIQVRGINSINAGSTPLIVVDGVPLMNYDLNNINSSDIASIEVLKDAASTAIYGSRGANGVILVTTKSGKPGKPGLNVSYNYSIQREIRGYEVMNSVEYAQAAIDAAQNGWIESGGDPNAPNTIEARGKYVYTWPEALENPETLPNTNWRDLIIRQAPMHEVHLDFSGGNDKSKYYFSAGLLDQEGIMITTDYKKYTLNLKGDSKITDWLTIGAMANATVHRENIYSSNFQNITQYPTIYPEYGQNGYLGGPGTVEGFDNYGQILYNITGHPYNNLGNKNLQNRFDGLGNIYGEVKLLPGLLFRSSFNIAYSRNDHSQYAVKDNNLGPAYIGIGRFTSTMNRQMNYSIENFLLFDKSFNNHSLNVLAGFEFNYRNFYMLQGQRTHYDNDQLPYLSAGNTISDAMDDVSTSALASYIARVNYSYKDKYLASATFRRDGSSRFGPDNKWGNFPSLSLGWRASEEEFMKNSVAISDLKIRWSIGYTGNDNFQDYRWISQMTMSRVPFGNNLVTSYYPSSIENANLRWERTLQYNLGIDLGIMKNRLAMEIDFYKSISDGLLLDVPVPSIVGFGSVFKNIGEIQNKGIELGLTSHNLSGVFNWTSQITFSANKNVVTKMGPNDAPRYYSHGQSIGGADFVGQPMGNFFGYKFIGVFMNQAEVDTETVEYPFTIHPGDAKYADINDDNVINQDDRTSIGNAQPDFIWSFNNSFKYKNFDFSFMLHGVVGNDVFNGNYRRSMIYHEGRNYMKRMNNRWRSESEPGDGTVPKVSVVLDGFEKTASSFWITDGTYLRLKNVTLGYNLPVPFMKKLGVASSRIYFNGLNLFTITKTEVEDPENFNGSGGLTSTIARGVSHGVYPTAKIYTLGIDLKF